MRVPWVCPSRFSHPQCELISVPETMSPASPSGFLCGRVRPPLPCAQLAWLQGWGLGGEDGSEQSGLPSAAQKSASHEAGALFSTTVK